MNFRKIEALDRRAAAVHEAGHIVIGRAHGIELEATSFEMETTRFTENHGWGRPTSRRSVGGR